MNRANALVLVDNPELVSSGLWPDRHVTQTPLWEVAQNVRFVGGKIVRRKPNSFILNDPGGIRPVRSIGQMQASDGVRWVYFNAGPDIYRWYGPAAEAVHTFGTFQVDATSTEDPTIFDFTNWSNWEIVNSADNGAWLHKPGVSFAALGGSAPQDAVAYFKKRNQLVAIGYGVNKRLVGTSDADNIEDWVATPTNLATELPLEELNSPVRSACHFGPSIAVFGETQMFEVKWVGAPFYYGQNKLLDGIGAIGKLAVCSVGRIVYGFGRNGAWKTDGMQFSYIDEVVIRDYFQNNINWAQAAKIVCRYNSISGCVEFSFPMRGSLVNNEAWSYDPRYGGWSPVPFFAGMDDRVLFSKPIEGQDNGDLQLMEDNPALEAPLLLETKALLIQRDNQYLHIGSIIDEVELFLNKASKVEMQYGVAEFPQGPFSWTDPFEASTEQVTYKIEQNLSGTYHKLRFRSYEVNWDIDLQGFALFGEPEGYKREKL